MESDRGIVLMLNFEFQVVVALGNFKLNSKPFSGWRLVANAISTGRLQMNAGA